MIQNDGKQDVFQQLQGWIQFGAASLAPHVLNHNTLGGAHAEWLLINTNFPPGVWRMVWFGGTGSSTRRYRLFHQEVG